MPRTNIGGLTDQDMILGYFVYDAHVIDVVCVHCRSSIVDHSHFINRSWPFFTIIIVSLIDVPYIFVCYISQDNVFCACLSSLTWKPPSQGMTEKQECLIEVKTKEGYNLWVIYTKDTELRKKTEVREDSGG